MITRIEVTDKNKTEKVFVYTIDKKLSSSQLLRIAKSLTNPVIQDFTINNGKSPGKFAVAVEIGFLPGVTDNVATTTREIIEDLLKTKFGKDEGVHTSQISFFKKTVKVDSLYNPLIQRIHVKKYLQFKRDGGMDRIVPKVNLTANGNVNLVDLEVADDELIKIGKSGIKNPDGTRRGPLALDLTYMRAVRDYFRKIGRNPTDIELESIAQTWSEHCKHTIFANPIDEVEEGLFNTYIKAATDKIMKKNKMCVSVFSDNSGAIEFNDKYLITHKAETHNSPSALDPYGGAITGIVGVNRDAIGFGLGAKPVINTYGFCFAEPSTKTELYKDEKLTQKMLSPKRIMEGVIAGVNSGGNCSGIPSPQGFMYFDPRYQGKPLVFVGTVGLIPKKIGKKLSYVKRARPGDYIVMVGGKVGLDGIHGATFSSEALDKGSPAGAVQIGDPITQKKLSDAIVKEARDMCLYNSITDNGAGGLSCSVAEMAKESGGCLVDLELVPLKYPGLSPWQIWVSESQERMTLAVPKDKWKKFNSLMKKRGVEATVIGRFTDSGKCIVRQSGKTIMNLDMKFLHFGLPVKFLKTKAPKMVKKISNIPLNKNSSSTLLSNLSHPNIASFQFVSGQYDHEVQGGSVIKPLIGAGLINGEASITKPVLDSQKGVALSQALYPEYGETDPYYMAALAIDTAIRNIVAVGGRLEKTALLDNFCWCSSNEPERLYQLKQAAKACFDYSVAYGTPFISGKDSMFNDFKGFNKDGKPIKISVPPTLLISSIGVIDNVEKTVSLDLKFPGDLVYLMGNITEKVQADKNKVNYEAFTKLVSSGLVASAIPVNRGGLAVAIAKSAMAGNLGVAVTVKGNNLFEITSGQIVLTVDPKNKNSFENIIKRLPFKLIGTVTDEKRIVIKAKNKKPIIDVNIVEAMRAYKSTFRNF